MLKLRSLSELASMVGGNGTRSKKTVSAISRMAKMDKMMKKMTKKDDRSDKWFLAPLSSQKVKNPTGKSGYSTAGTRRKAEHISDLLFRPISQIMCLGVLDPRIKVELSKVRVLADFSCIKLHWLASDKHDHNLAEQLLQTRTVAMQDLVKELQILSNVPPIRFVKDMSLASVQEVERLLQQADLGPPDEAEDSCDDEVDDEVDDEDTKTKTVLKTPVDTPISASLKDIAKRFRLADTTSLYERLGDNVDVNSDPNTQFTELTARFRQDLYGLNHESMTQKISILKSGLRISSCELDSEPEKVKTNMDRKRAREQYAKVLQIQRNQRQILRKERKNKHLLLSGRDESDDMEDILLR